MTSTTTPRGGRGRRAALDRNQAATLAADENARFVALVRSLGDADWGRPTDCPGWDVRTMVSHVVGAMESHVSTRELVHQLWAGTRAAGDRPQVDGINDVQVRERRHLGPHELTDRLASVAPRSATARFRFPALLRAVSFPQDVGGRRERWTLGYLFDIVYTRDVWMHRVDLCRALDRPMALTSEHDGVFVADVVAEWAQRHASPYHLVLTGPAGGTFAADADGEQHELDAVEFCRIVSGRSTGTGLLRQPVPF